jgi:hypothetical protein
MRHTFAVLTVALVLSVAPLVEARDTGGGPEALDGGGFTYLPGLPPHPDIAMNRDGPSYDHHHYAQLGSTLWIMQTSGWQDEDEEYFDGEFVGLVVDGIALEQIHDNQAGGIFWTPPGGSFPVTYTLPDHKLAQQPVLITTIEDDVPNYADDPRATDDYPLTWGPARAELKCTDNDYTTWLPQGAPNENGAPFKIRTMDNDTWTWENWPGNNDSHFVPPPAGTHAFLCMQVLGSELPGVCSNYGADAGPDFTWAPPWGPNGEPWEYETDGVLEASLDSHDWGGDAPVGVFTSGMPRWDTPEANFELGVWVPSPQGVGAVQLPFDPDYDGLPHGWEIDPRSNTATINADTDGDGIGDADEDEDHEPYHEYSWTEEIWGPEGPPAVITHTMQTPDGDGFPNFDEYRGFVCLDGGAVAYERAHTNVKHVFVRNVHDLPMDYFWATGLTIHSIDDTMWDGSAAALRSGVINFNGAVSQCGILLMDVDQPELADWRDLVGDGLTMGNDVWPEGPNWYDGGYSHLPSPVRCFLPRSVDTDPAWLRKTVAHELGHAVGMNKPWFLTGIVGEEYRGREIMSQTSAIIERGPDGEWGIAGVDDDGDGTVDEREGEFDVPGSDDLIKGTAPSTYGPKSLAELGLR